MTHATTYKRACRFSALQSYCLGTMLLLPSLGKAAVEGIPCAPEPTNMLISFGDLVNCQIDTIGDLDTFRFSGAAGELIRVQFGRTSGFGQPIFDVFAPDGTLVCSAGLGGGQANCDLTQTGLHTILIDEFFMDQTPSYALALERIVPPSVAAPEIKDSQPIQDEINGVGDIDSFFFAGTAGTLVTVQVARTSGSGQPIFDVFAPDGTPVCSAGLGGGQANCDLTQTGPHTILVDEFFADQILAYTLIQACLVGACPPPPSPGPPPEAEPATPQIPIPCRGSRCGVPVICNLSPDLATPCTNQIDLFAFVPRNSLRLSDDTPARAQTRIRFAFGISNIPPGEIADVRLKLTKRGKKIARMGTKRLRGVLEIRNTPGDLINSTQVRIRIRRR